MHLDTATETRPFGSCERAPGFLKRSVEFFFTGSVRLQLLQTLNAREASTWRLLSGPQLGFDVRNQSCGASFLFDAPGRLSAIHITNAQGTLSLEGDCSLGQHLLDGAIQSCAKLLYESKQLAATDLVRAVSGDLSVETTYEATDGYERNPPDGWEWWTRRNVTLSMSSGRVALHYSKFTRCLSSQAYHDRFDGYRSVVDDGRSGSSDLMYGLRSSLPYSFAFPVQEACLDECRVASIPPRQDTTVKRSASISNTYTAIARILASPDLSTEMQIGDESFDAALAMAAKAHRKQS